MDSNLERECSALGGLFQTIVNDLKTSHPAWEDLGQKAVKLSTQLKGVITTMNHFLDAMQRVADYATNAKGATRDIGTALTRICMRHRSVENRLKTLASALVDCLVAPLAERADDWQRRAAALDRDHARHSKRQRAHIRKRAADALRMHKKVRKGDTRMQPMLDSAVHEVNENYLVLLESERKMVRQAMIEQRSQFCYFVSFFKPILDLEMGLLDEIPHLQEVSDLLCKNAMEPNVLPAASEAVIFDAKGLELTWTESVASPPSSPSSLGSRKSSFCSLSSSGDSAPHSRRHPRRAPHPHHHHPQTPLAQQPPPPAAAQLNRMHSHPASNADRMSLSADSGIAATSQDVVYAPIVRATTSAAGGGVAELPSSLDERTFYRSATADEDTPSPSPTVATWPHEQPLLYNAPSTGHRVGAQTVCVGAQRRQPLPPPHAFVAPPPPPSRHERVAAHSSMQRPVTLGLQKMRQMASNARQRQPRQNDTPLMTPTPTMGSAAATPQIPDFNMAQPDQFVPQPVYANAHDLRAQQVQQQRRQRHLSDSLADDMQGAGGGGPPAVTVANRRHRPLSFVGDQEDMHRLLQVAGLSIRGGGSVASSISHSDSTATVTSTSNVSTLETDDDTLIDQALDEIDQLTTDLERYAAPTPQPLREGSAAGPDATGGLFDGVSLRNAPSYCTLPRLKRKDDTTSLYERPLTTVLSSFANHKLQRENDDDDGRSVSEHHQGVTRRPSTQQRPPPPVRRGSTISAATPTAPPVDRVAHHRPSRSTTPVEETYSEVMEALEAQFSTHSIGGQLTTTHVSASLHQSSRHTTD